MGGAAVNAVDYGDVQGLVRFGYRHLKAARYLLLGIRDRQAAQAWLSAAPVTSAEFRQPPPPDALHVALTAAGLQALGVPAALAAQFSPEFLGGMTDASRTRRLGDTGSNAPTHWRWGGSASTPHVLVMCFARDLAGLDAMVARTTGGDFVRAFDVQHALDTSDQDGIEPFGFADGLSQPSIDWEQATDPAERMLDYGERAALGEFVLGYANEYGKFTDRPLVAPGPDSTALPDAADEPAMKDVGRNGTYLVLRQLVQDVRGFWRFVHGAAGGDPEAADRLASAFVGRTRDGEPLVSPDALGRGQNDFTFDADPRGVVCPMGAHIRRSNPRNADFPGRPTGVRKLLAALGGSSKGFRDDLIAPVRFHRILRRGREYGPSLEPADAVQAAPPGEAERGLHFVCLNANLSRQFEFLQNAWLMNTTFADLRGETDPLVGTRESLPGCPATGEFSWPQEGAPARRVDGLPQFVTVKGGEYFFLPGLRALRYLSSLGGRLP
ncbi:MAG: Dyp-type peroxidase [Vicinamibacterales bacterium]